MGAWTADGGRRCYDDLGIAGCGQLQIFVVAAVPGGKQGLRLI
jgi:hypothetical protein